jgi:arylsulfatase A-like enzyme
MEHVRAGWRDCGAQRDAMLGAAMLLVLAAAAFRWAILWGDFPVAGPVTRLGWLLATVREDVLVVGALLLVGVAVGPLLPAGLARRVWGHVWTVLALALLVIGFSNVFAVEILGGPVTRDWILYSDIGNTDVILDSILFVVTPFRAAVLVAAILGFLLGARALSRHVPSMAAWRAVPVVGLVLIAAPVLTPADADPVPQGKVANPVIALARSYIDRGGFPLGDIAGGVVPRDPPDMGLADPIARPDVPEGAIRNVIVVAIDAVSTRYIEGFGGSYPITPNILRYQDQGMSFANAYAHVPASNYFLVTLLAGMVPELTPDSMTYAYDALELDTLSAALAERGYRTGFFNSSDNRFQNTETFVRQAGFETVRDYRDWECAQGVYATEGFADSYLNTSNDHCTIDAMTDWIAEAPDEPFLMVMRTGMSHYPYYPGEDPQPFVEDANLNNYLNAIRVSDAAFGQLMGWLEERGLADETLVIVLGDHGEAFGEHGTGGHASGIYEENVNVPLLFVNPVVFSGERFEQIVGLSEIAPTVADLLGLPPSPQWQARSVFATGRPDGVMFFSPWNGFLIGFRQGDRKFIYNGNTDESWLFDLAEDPGETVNLVASEPEADAAARRLVADWVAYHTGWVARFIGGQVIPTSAAPVPEGPGALVLRASGTSYLTPPQAEIVLDGEVLGRAVVTAAPSNADAAVTVQQVAAGETTFRFDVPEIRCASRVEIRFLNDEWEGEGQTGDTDFYIAGLEFAGRSYGPGQVRILTERAGGVRDGYFVLWRTGAAVLDLYVPSDCVAERLLTTAPVEEAAQATQ